MTHLSLFSGIGGLDLAAEWAGFRSVGFVEQNPFCQQVLAKHWPGVPIFDDIKTTGIDTFRERGIERPTVISGGVPCQGISAANKTGRGLLDPRSALFYEFSRVAFECGAIWLVLENSPRIISNHYSDVSTEFARRGYVCESFVLGSGTVHQRKRGYFVAHIDEVGGKQKVQSVKALVLDAERKRQVSNKRGIKFILRTNADPVFTFEDGGQRMVAPVFCRATDAIPNRVDRLRALGNAVVPQQAYPIFAAIAKEILNEKVSDE